MEFSVVDLFVWEHRRHRIVANVEADPYTSQETPRQRRVVRGLGTAGHHVWLVWPGRRWCWHLVCSPGAVAGHMLGRHGDWYSSTSRISYHRTLDKEKWETQAAFLYCCPANAIQMGPGSLGIVKKYSIIRRNFSFLQDSHITEN